MIVYAAMKELIAAKYAAQQIFVLLMLKSLKL